jgi:hypothetical protein
LQHITFSVSTLTCHYRVHCLEAFSIDISPQGVAKPASNWVDIGSRQITLHLLLGSEEVRLLTCQM